ncbi:hypothetical protein GQR58_012859 [Nymphon striatum]|nr:hypothetical protein GQR58_012859 [Nymphon striatum]
MVTEHSDQIRRNLDHILIPKPQFTHFGSGCNFIPLFTKCVMDHIQCFSQFSIVGLHELVLLVEFSGVLDEDFLYKEEKNCKILSTGPLVVKGILVIFSEFDYSIWFYLKLGILKQIQFDKVNLHKHSLDTIIGGGALWVPSPPGYYVSKVGGEGDYFTIAKRLASAEILDNEIGGEGNPHNS